MVLIETSLQNFIFTFSPVMKSKALSRGTQLNFKLLVLYAPFCPTVYLCDDWKGLVVRIGLKKKCNMLHRACFFLNLTGLVCNECSRLAPLLCIAAILK